MGDNGPSSTPRTPQSSPASTSTTSTSDPSIPSTASPTDNPSVTPVPTPSSANSPTSTIASGNTSISQSAATSPPGSYGTPSTATEATVTTTSETTQSAAATVTSSSTSVNDGAIAGGVVGGTLFLALLILGIILCRRARRRKHIAPSSEFAETIKRGEMPVLRLDSGVEIIPTTPLHVPLPHQQQDSYRTSLPMSDMKPPEGMMWSDAQSTRYSLQKPLQPLRFPVHKDSDDSMMHPGHIKEYGTDESQDYWSGESGNVDSRKGFVSQSPDHGYSPLVQNIYPIEHPHAVETAQNAYGNLWELSVAPTTPSRLSSTRYNEDGQALPPLVPMRRSVDIVQRQ